MTVQVARLPTHSPSDRAIGRWTVFLLGCILIATAALAWSNPFIPGQDGPMHVNIASILADLLFRPGSLNGSFYQLRPGFFTNFGVDAIALPLLPWFGPVAIEKLVFTVVVVGIPAGIILAIRAVAGRVSPFMLLAVPYGYTQTVASGNYNFLLAIVLGLFVFAAVLRRPGVPSRTMTMGLAFCWLIVAFVHPAATVVMLFCIGVLVLVAALQLADRERGKALCLLGAHGLAVSPALAVLAVFFAFSPPSDMEYQRGVYLRLRELILQYEIYKLGRQELLICLTLSATLLGTALFALRRRLPLTFLSADRLLAVAGACVVLYFVAPNRLSGGDSFVARIELLPWIILLIWLSAQQLPRRVLWGILALGTLVDATVLAGAYSTHAVASADMARYFAMSEAITPGSVVLPVIGDYQAHDAEGHPIRMHAAVFQHLHNTVAIERRSVFLENWSAHFRVANVMFRADHDPYIDLLGSNDLAGVPRFEARTGVRPDYVFVWRLAADDARLPALRKLLDGSYEQVASLLSKRPGPPNKPDPSLSGIFRRRTLTAAP
jgi:hypothetical protein